MAFTLTGAQAADIGQAPRLLSAIAPPQAVIADQAYDADALIDAIHQRCAQAVIPPRRHRIHPRPWDRYRYRARHLIENLFARLKAFRRLATRYEKLDVHYAAFVILASIYVWLA